MKKTYTAPAIVTNGNVVHETLSSSPGPNEFIGRLKVEGSVGFNL
jgi:hypothetical protein